MYELEKIYNLNDLDYSDAKMVVNIIQTLDFNKDEADIVKNGILSALKYSIENYANPEVYNVVADFMYMNFMDDNDIDGYYPIFLEYFLHSEHNSTVLNNQYESPEIVDDIVSLLREDSGVINNESYIKHKLRNNNEDITNLVKNNNQYFYFLIKNDVNEEIIITGVNLLNYINDKNNFDFINVFFINHNQEMLSLIEHQCVNNKDNEDVYLEMVKKYCCQIGFDEYDNNFLIQLSNSILSNYYLSIETFERLSEKINFNIGSYNENELDIHPENFTLMAHIVKNYRLNKTQMVDMIEHFVCDFSDRYYEENECINIKNLMNEICIYGYNDILIQNLIDEKVLAYIEKMSGKEIGEKYTLDILFEQQYSNIEYIKELVKVNVNNELTKNLFFNHVDFIKEQLKMDYENNKDIIPLIQNNSAFNNLNSSEKEIYNDFVQHLNYKNKLASKTKKTKLI